ncbi:MAG: type II secretion system protein [Candidatus Omnitrophota bacterium]|nr:type II secretion system protein [Candidatus Omnitrophota bacterium]
MPAILKKKGFTLVELMLAAMILIVVLVALLGGYFLAFNLNETAKNLTISTYSVEQKLEEIRGYNFNLIFNDYNNTMFRADNATLIAGNPIQIVFTPNLDTAGSVSVDNSDDNLLKITVTMCWRQQGGRIIGEDNGQGGGIPLNGILDGAEDANNNNIMDSPVQVVTLMANR